MALSVRWPVSVLDTHKSQENPSTVFNNNQEASNLSCVTLRYMKLMSERRMKIPHLEFGLAQLQHKVKTRLSKEII